jgi:hypothetical protein
MKAGKVEEISNFQIEDDMKGVPGFLGVYAHDQVGDVVPKEGDSLIMNLDTIHQGGSHWVAMYFGDYAYYFDSFGVPPDDRSLDCLDKYDKDIRFSEEQIQEDCSQECGYYSMAFIRAMNSGMTFQEFLREFTSLPSEKNEKEAVEMAVGEEGSGLFQNIRKAFTGNYSGESDFMKWVNDNSGVVISSIVVCRQPVKSAITNALNIITAGKFNATTKKLGYDQLFHLSMIINGKWRVEKNSIVKVSNDVTISSDMQTMNVSLKGQIKIGDFFNMAISTMGEKSFFVYDAFSTNCQLFIQGVLSSNGLLTPDLDNFILQNAGDILRGLPGYTSTLASTLTDLGSFVGAGL